MKMSLLCNKLLLTTNRLFFNNSHLSRKPVLTYVRCFASSPKSKKSLFKLGLVGITVGALVGTGYSIHHLNKPKAHILNEQIKIPLVQSVPIIQPSRKVSILNRTICMYTNYSKCTGCFNRRPIWFKISIVSISDLSILLQSACVFGLLWNFLRYC